MEKDKLSIILLNHNNTDFTIPCLNDLKNQSYTNFEVIIVENNSRHEEREKLLQYIQTLNQGFTKNLKVLKENKNFGFAKGNNLAIKQAKGDIILILNNDTELYPDFLEKCIKFLKRDIVNVMSPKIMYYKNKNKIWTAGGQVNYLTPGLSVNRGANEIDNKQYDFITRIDFAPGCCLFIKKNVLDVIGLFDEDYFIYFEETDLCHRARLMNFQTFFYPHAKLFHKVNDNISEFHIYLYFRNKFIFLLKFFPIYKIIIQFVLQPLQIFAYAINRKTNSFNFRILRKCIKFIFLGIRMGLLKRYHRLE